VNETGISAASGLPGGTVTFLFTDIEGSTRLERELRDRYSDVLAEHRRLLREAFGQHGGHEIDTQGDSFFFVFPRARDAVAAAVAGQRALAEHDWPEAHAVRVRIGMHTGEATLADGRYVGLAVHRAARISAAGHGGQILLSSSTRDVVEDDLPADQRLADLGEHRLKDLPRPERVFQLVAVGLPEEFPRLKTMGVTSFEGREGELAEAVVEELGKGWRRPGRRGLIAATAAAAAIGVVIGLLATQGGGSEARAEVAGNAVGVIDSDGDIVSEVDVGEAPADVAAAADAVWVTNATDDTVSRIDPVTHDVRQTIEVGGGPAGVAIGGGGVWVANGVDATISRIDPATNKEVQRITVGNGPTGVAFGEGAVWVTNSVDGSVSRIAPGPSRVTETFPALVGAASVAVGFGRVWVASPATASVVALDPGSGKVLARIGVGVEPAAVAIGSDAVWVANRADGTVSKINPRVDAVTATVQVGRGPEGIAVGPDAIWVANGGDGTLSRIDPESGRLVQTVLLANPPRGIALSDEGLYVAVRSTGEEHRGGELRVQADSPPDSIDPALAYGGGGSWAALTMTNDGLVTFRKVAGVEGTQLVPDLAVALPTATGGGKAYTFELRRGISYSDGTLVQPEDFRRAVERLFELESPGAPYYTGVLGASRCRKGRRCNLARGIVTDRVARTVSFRLSAPDADFPAKLAMPFAFAVPAKTGPRKVSRPVPATGPYRIVSYRARSKTLRLVRNPRFREWSRDAQPDGFPDSFVFTWPHGFNEVVARVRDVERGKADLALAGGPPIPKARLAELAVRYPDRLHVTPELSTIYYFLSTRVPPFSDPRAREAVRISWDRDALGDAVGVGWSPTCRILPRNFPGYRPCPAGAGGVIALDRARRLVRASGTQGARVTVWTPSAAPPELARYVASLLQSLGYRASVNARYEAGQGPYFRIVTNPRTRAQIGFGGWGLDFPSAEGFLRPLTSCGAYNPASPETTTNLAGFCDRSIDAQMDRAVATQVHDPAEATAEWQRIEDAILARAPIIPAFNRTYVTLLSARAGNYQHNPQWGILLSQLWVR
jgi:peptide/nickel transport system substrate-binding protein